MKPLTLAVVLLALVGCQKGNTVVTDVTKVSKTDTVITPPKPPGRESPLYLIDSVAIDGKMFTVVQAYPTRKSELDLRILYKGDTIYRHDNRAYNGFEFEDFDGDGKPEIRLYQLSNVGGISELLMYDSQTKNFKNIKHFTTFPSPEKLAGTKYYYSDHRMGCAGGMWGSELFYIKNFKAIAIGRIFIVTCETADYEKGVYIYKINGNREEQVERLKSVPERFEAEQDFFLDYWSKNYKAFE